ncbi:MAG TPA: helix-turn-helix domain-containing protein [Candidatus Binatia bacterium]|nr:helix-turn-helix domain-containing protein [Candidatus Binatia bacterium]
MRDIGPGPARDRGEVALVEDVLGCKWTVQILGAIAAGIVRPGRLQRSIPGLSTKVMNERLAKLVRRGVLERAARSGPRLHVEYRLTPKGRDLARLVAAVDRFCRRWQAGRGLVPEPPGVPRLASRARQGRRFDEPGRPPIAAGGRVSLGQGAATSDRGGRGPG